MFNFCLSEHYFCGRVYCMCKHDQRAAVNLCGGLDPAVRERYGVLTSITTFHESERARGTMLLNTTSAYGAVRQRTGRLEGGRQAQIE
jgi:hypothetical protein